MTEMVDDSHTDAVDYPSEDEEDENHLINVNIYDTHSLSTIQKVNSSTLTSELCCTIASKLDLSQENAKFHSLVLIVTAQNSRKQYNSHCVRTLSPNEVVLEIRGVIISKLMEKHKISDSKVVSDTVRWFYKDIRTNPIDLGDSGEVTGEYPSDDEEEISHSDLAYLAKAERKGYLLKRSSKDMNLWRRWYCALTDHLWCVDINRDNPRAICIKLSGMIRYKQVNSHNNGSNSNDSNSLQTIIINSLKQTHFFRAFNISEHRKWLDDLYIKTSFAQDNDYFSMAEVIICDEEMSASRRMHKHVGDALDIDTVFDCIAYGDGRHLSLPPPPAVLVSVPPLLSTARSKTESTADLTNGSSGSTRSSQAVSAALKGVFTPVKEPRTPPRDFFMGDLASAVEDLIDSSDSSDSSENDTNNNDTVSGTTPSNSRPNSRRGSFVLDHLADEECVGRSSLQSLADIDEASEQFLRDVAAKESAANIITTNINGNNDNNSNSSINKSQDISRLSPAFIALAKYSQQQQQQQQQLLLQPSRAVTISDPMDRSQRLMLVHRLHHSNQLLFFMLCFLADVQVYREMHRHDLTVAPQEQYSRAVSLYIKYLVPQLLSHGVSLGPHFLDYYAGKVTANGSVFRGVNSSGNSAVAASSSGQQSGRIRANTVFSTNADNTTPRGGQSKNARSGSGSSRIGSRFRGSSGGSFGSGGTGSKNNSFSFLSRGGVNSRGGSKSETVSVSNPQPAPSIPQIPQQPLHHWGVSTEHLLKIHILLYGCEEIGESDIVLNGLSDFVAQLKAQQKHQQEMEEAAIRLKQAHLASQVPQAPVAVAPASTSSFWSWYTTPAEAANASASTLNGSRSATASPSNSYFGSGGGSSNGISDRPSSSSSSFYQKRSSIAGGGGGGSSGVDHVPSERSPLSPDLFDDVTAQLLRVLRGEEEMKDNNGNVNNDKDNGKERVEHVSDCEATRTREVCNGGKQQSELMSSAADCDTTRA